MSRFLIVLLSLLIISNKIECQRLPVEFSQYVRDTLSKAWDNPKYQTTEQVGCLTYHKQRDPSTDIYVVDSIVSPLSVEYKTTYYVKFVCPPNTINFHTHDMTTCKQVVENDGGTYNVKLKCELGGEDAYFCMATDPDIIELKKLGDPFAVFQCDKHALIPYFPSN